MELDRVLSTLRAHKLLVALVVVASLIAGALVSYRFSGFPPTPTARVLPRAEADRQILIDSPSPALVETKADIETLTARTPWYAQVMTSAALRDGVARVTHIPARLITTEGPWTGPAAGQDNDVPSEARGMQIAGESAPYRLSFVPRLQLPVLTIHAEAPSKSEAIALANGAVTAIRRFRNHLFDQLVNRPKRPVVVRPIGVVQTTERGGHSAQIQAGLVTAAGVLAGLLVLVSGAEMRRRLRPPTQPTTFPEMTS